MEIKKCPICDQKPKMKSYFIEDYGEYFLNLKCCNFETAYHKNISEAVKDWNEIIEKIEVAENCSEIIKDAIKESFDDIKWSDIDSITNLPIDDQATYYDAGGISTMDVIRAKLTEEQFKGFLLGNVIKYSCRLNHKDNQKRDAEKIANYSKILSEL